MKIHYYANGGSRNHGCEAIYRSLIRLLSNHEHIIHSHSEGEDRLYGLDKISSIVPLSIPVSPTGIDRVIYALQLKWHKNDKPYFDRTYSQFIREAAIDDIYLSVGGDNYCYSSYDWLEYLNHRLTSKGCRTILAGCSIEPDSLTHRLIQDLKRYSLIIARESCTYSALNKAGLVNTTLLPDPAFSLPTQKKPLPGNMIPGNTVGINISPVISQLESTAGIAYENYRELIKHIIEKTDMSILLIPHVVKETNDDRIPSTLLMQEFEPTGRIALINDADCCTIKGFVAQCRFFIAARTHASIAAYSTCVPTLVVGYSIKAKGLALDIFQNCDDYILPTQSLTESSELTRLFEKMVHNEEKIKKHLAAFMPSYIEKCNDYDMLLTQIK